MPKHYIGWPLSPMCDNQSFYMVACKYHVWFLDNLQGLSIPCSPPSPNKLNKCIQKLNAQAEIKNSLCNRFYILFILVDIQCVNQLFYKKYHQQETAVFFHLFFNLTEKILFKIVKKDILKQLAFVYTKVKTISQILVEQLFFV